MARQAHVAEREALYEQYIMIQSCHCEWTGPSVSVINLVVSLG